MPAAYKHQTKVTLPNLGELTAEVIFYPGHGGSYVDPAEGSEVNVISVSNDNGPVILTEDQYEEYYCFFLDAAEETHYQYLTTRWNTITIKSDLDTDIPF